MLNELVAEGGWFIEFSYAMVLGGGIASLISLFVCNMLLYENNPYIRTFGNINWEVVMYNMIIGGSTIYFIICVKQLVYGLGDVWTVWIALGMVLLAICIVLMLLSSAKASMKNKQMMIEFNQWLLKRGKTLDVGFKDLVNYAIDITRPDMEGRMEIPSFEDMKEFSKERYPDFYKYLTNLEKSVMRSDI